MRCLPCLLLACLLGSAQAPPSAATAAPAPTGDDLPLANRPPVVIAGRVVDAATGQPIDSFKVIIGDVMGSDVFWERYRPIHGSNGRYTLQKGGWGGRVRLLLEAEGYLPAVSPVFNAQTGFTNVLALKKGAGPKGIVKLPNGQPAAGVQVALLAGEYTVLKGHQLQQNGNEHSLVETDSQGKFSLPPFYGTQIVAVGSQGYAEAELDPTSPADLTLTLQPWGRLEGTVRNGRHPATNTWVMVADTRGSLNIRLQYDFESYRKEADSQGHFVIANVPPGERHLTRIYPVGRGWTWSHGQTVLVKAGETTHIDYGGHGRLVVGKVKPNDPARQIPWKGSGQHMLATPQPKPPGHFKNEEEVEAWANSPAVKQARAQSRTYLALFQDDGSFRIEDVPPGKYDMSFEFFEPAPQGVGAMGKSIGSIRKEVEVPPLSDAAADEPFDLGTLELVIKKDLKPGDLAPDFTVNDLAGKPLQLADFHGKYLLLDFWATWCGPCVAEVPLLKQTWAAFGARKNFTMLSLSLDAEVKEPREFVRKRDVAWPQGFLGEWSKTKLPDQYGVNGIPAIFLIGPNGRIVATDLRGPEIQAAVEKALGPMK